jgi:pyridoxine kinase
MNYKRILTIQDISCVGQCSLTVALPILSAAGLECAILPSAVLSTHTAGFSGFTVRDLSEDIPAINAHWVKEGIKFSAIYTGYLGSTSQVDMVLDIKNSSLTEDGVFFVDPAMADNGKLYPAFDDEYVKAMVRLCGEADYIIPNITEACFLTGIEYKTEYDREYIDLLLSRLNAMGCKNVIFTGISYREGYTGVVVLENGVYSYYEHEKIAGGCHGTGDVYASAFVGALVRGKGAYEAARIAAEYTLECIKETVKLDGQWYGAAFELAVPKLIELLK